ncbi:hypothetical protein MRX96_035943 [Rhipicephalus microplus]
MDDPTPCADCRERVPRQKEERVGARAVPGSAKRGGKTGHGSERGTNRDVSGRPDKGRSIRGHTGHVEGMWVLLGEDQDGSCTVEGSR